MGDRKQEILQHVTIRSVASRYAEVKRVGSEYVTLCPWHQDTKPSLTIYEGREGHERCHCFACGASGNVIDYYMQQTGCDFPTAIDNLSQGVLTGAAAKPITAKDKPIKPAEWRASKPPQASNPPLKHWEFGDPIASWCYRDENGEPLYYEARYLKTDENGETQKEPRCWTWGRFSENTVFKWSCRHWQAPRPAYGLDQLAKYTKVAADSQILIFEGPRKADLAQGLLSLACMAWATGAQGWKHTDWSMLAGRRVILWPDNDAPGKQAMAGLAQHLLKQGCAVFIVNIPVGKPDKWDICDEQGLTADQLKIWLKDRKEVTMQAQAAAATRTKYVLDPSKVLADDGFTGVEAQTVYADGYTPPPIEAVPEHYQDPDDEPPAEGGAWEPDVEPEGIEPPKREAYVRPSDARHPDGEWPDPENIIDDPASNRISRDYLPELVGGLAFLKAPATGSDAGAIAMSMLATIASAIDDRLKLYPDRHGGWAESARIWVALVGSPSAKKTFCAEYAAKPLKDADDEVDQANEHQKKKFKALMKKYDSALSEWMETDQSTPAPVPPQHPEITRYYMSNTTIEAFGDVMQYNPRGTLIFYDELSGWIGGMGQFKASGGSDRADWLMSYNGGPQRIDRITRGSIRVPNFSASVIGGIQPDTIARIAKSTSEDGLLQRFYISFVPEAEPGDPPTIAQARSIKEFEDRYRSLIRHLLGMKSDGAKVYMSDQARQITLKTFRDIHKLASLNSFGYKASAAMAKFEGGMHRMCLIYHAIDCFQAGKHPADVEVSPQTAEMVCRLYKSYILPNIITFYNSIIGDASPAANDLKRAGNFILSRRLEKLTASDLRNYTSLKSRSISERKEVISHLTEAGWVEPTGHYASNTMPRQFKVNPLVHTKFAEYRDRELRRLELTREAMLACGMKPGGKSA